MLNSVSILQRQIATKQDVKFLETLIFRGFVWNKTQQGHDYWKKWKYFLNKKYGKRKMLPSDFDGIYSTRNWEHIIFKRIVYSFLQRVSNKKMPPELKLLLFNDINKFDGNISIHIPEGRNPFDA